MILKSTILTPPILYSSSPLILLDLLRPYNLAASPQRNALEEAVVACAWFHLYFVMRMPFSTSSTCLVLRGSTPFNADARSDFLRARRAFFLVISPLACSTFARNSSACVMICRVLSTVWSLSASVAARFGALAGPPRERLFLGPWTVVKGGCLFAGQGRPSRRGLEHSGSVARRGDSARLLGTRKAISIRQYESICRTAWLSRTMRMTRSEEFDRGNVVLSTQRRKLWRTLSGQAHTYRTGNKVGGKGEVVIG